MCVCTTFMPASHGDEERALVYLEVELKMVMSYHMGAGNQVHFLSQSS